MRVLLAGGAGFIGSHLSDKLVEDGHEVVAVDNFTTGRRSNVVHLEGHPRFSLIELDITRQIQRAGALFQPFDAVLNFASPASPMDFKTMPLEILEVGSTGTRNLLEIARVDSARFMLASTSEVYGDPLVHPQPESYLGNVSSIGPRSCYDEAKRFSEALTMAYHRVHGVDIRIARIFNTYGERMKPDDGRVVSSFVSQALRGEDITLYGDGNQTRSFCYIKDEVEGLVGLLKSSCTQPMNIGNPEEFTVRELAEEVIEISGSKSHIRNVPLPYERDGDPMRRQPDISFASEVLGWSPTIDLFQGLTKMIDYFVNTENIDQ